MFAVKDTASLPLVVLAPVQSPDAVQDVGLFVADQVSLDVWPVVTVAGVAERVTTGLVIDGGGAGVFGAFAVTVTEALPVPPEFRQLSVYV